MAGLNMAKEVALTAARLKAAELTTEVIKADLGAIGAAYVTSPELIEKLCEGYSRLHKTIVHSIVPDD